jgi:hypothetical protein
MKFTKIYEILQDLEEHEKIEMLRLLQAEVEDWDSLSVSAVEYQNAIKTLEKAYYTDGVRAETILKIAKKY